MRTSRRSEAASSAAAPGHDFQPTQVLEVELSGPIPAITQALSTTQTPYGDAQLLVRLHNWPIGTVVVDLADGDVSATAVEARIHAELQPAIDEHLRANGEEAVGTGGQVSQSTCQDGLELGEDAPLVSAVVATARRPDLLGPCLERILANDYPNFEVLVVDNSPDDPRTRELVEACSHPEHRIRYLREWTPGLSRARNTGLAFSRGEIVAFTDDDVLVDTRWIRSLVAALQSEPDAACATGLVVAAELETEGQVWFERFGGFNKGYQRRVFDLTPGPGDSPLYPYNVGLFGTGANMAFRKAMLDDLFSFDVNLGAGTLAQGGEDLDCFIELLHQGRSVVYDPRAVVWHRHRREPEQLRRMMRSYGIGLSAFLTKQFLIGSRRKELLRKLPAGVAWVRRPESRQATGASGDLGRNLARAELVGMAGGPIKYLHSRLHNAWLTA